MSDRILILDILCYAMLVGVPSLLILSPLALELYLRRRQRREEVRA